MSHDRFAEILGTTRQTVIGWEKGVEPKKYAERLAAFSGFPASAFRRREAESLTGVRQEDRTARLDRRLEALEAADEAKRQEVEALALLVAGLVVRVERLEGAVSEKQGDS